MPFPSTKTFYLISAVLLGTIPSFANASLRGNRGIYHQEEHANRVLEESVVGLYLIKADSHATYDHRILQAGEHSNDRTGNIELANGRIYEVTNAQGGWEESLESGSDKILIPPGSVISSSGIINVKGKKLSKVNGSRKKDGMFHRTLLGRDNVSRTPDQERNLAELQSSRKLQMGTKTVLAVRVILDDAKYNVASQAGLSNDIFGNGIDPVNLKSQFAACSYNQLIFDKSPNRLMSNDPNDDTTAISNGVVDIKVALRSQNNVKSIANAVTEKINLVFGVDSPKRLANHVMYCLPNGVISYAYAYVNSWNSVYGSDRCNKVSYQMHEVSQGVFLSEHPPHDTESKPLALTFPLFFCR